MGKAMTSRTRMLATLECRETDYVPCCFMVFDALHKRYPDRVEYVRRQLEMGLDARMQLTEMPVRHHPDVETRQWKDPAGDDGCPRLHKDYITPAGTLHTVVRKDPEWPHGDDVPFMDDFLSSRAERFLIDPEASLEALSYLLAEPTAEDIAQVREEARVLGKAAAELGVFLEAGYNHLHRHDWGCAGLDMLGWLCGFQEMVLMGIDAPEFLEELLTLVAAWLRKRMEILLDVGIDLFFKRAWYEGTALWSPALFRRFMLPVLKEEVNFAHEAGVKFGYIQTAGSMSLLDDMAEAGVDVLMGIDPVQGGDTELGEMNRRTAGRFCLWGGMNGFVTVEMGTAAQVAAAAKEAIELTAPDGGFILSPVDNVVDTSPKTWENVDALIRTWKACRSPGQ